MISKYLPQQKIVAFIVNFLFNTLEKRNSFNEFPKFVIKTFRDNI